MLRSAAVAMTLAACGSPPEPTVTPEPTIAAPPPSQAPPSSIAEVEAPPPTTDDGIDHSTDTSTDPADHATHVHTHDPVALDGPPEGVGLGTIGASGHPEYRGGVGAAHGSLGRLGTPH